MNESNEKISQLLEKTVNMLEITNRLLVLQLVKDLDLVKDKVLLLLDGGLKPSVVSSLLDIPLGSVTKAKSRSLGKTDH